MDTENFEKLDSTTQISLIIAMHIRNEMESFHSAHLSDEQMKRLNPIIRQAIYNILKYLELAAKEENDSEKVAAKELSIFRFNSHSKHEHIRICPKSYFRK